MSGIQEALGGESGVSKNKGYVDNYGEMRDNIDEVAALYIQCKKRSWEWLMKQPEIHSGARDHWLKQDNRAIELFNAEDDPEDQLHKILSRDGIDADQL